MAAFQALPGFTKMLVTQVHTIADHATAPGRFVLCQHDNGSYFTAWQNTQDGGMYYGHYGLTETEAREDLRKRFKNSVWERMNDRIKRGAIIEVTKDGRTIRATVTRVINCPNFMHQGGFFDIEYDIEESGYVISGFAIPRVRPGRWKQQTDGGTVKIVKDAS